MKCRCCKRDFKEPRGCAICQPTRDTVQQFMENIQWEEKEFDLDSFCTQGLRLLKINQDRLEKAMTEKSPRGNNLVGMGFNSEHAREARELAKAQSVIIKEARAMKREKRLSAEKMSTKERCEVFLGFFKKLPQEYQTRMFQAIGRAYNEVHSGKSKAN